MEAMIPVLVSQMAPELAETLNEFNQLPSFHETLKLSVLHGLWLWKKETGQDVSITHAKIDEFLDGALMLFPRGHPGEKTLATLKDAMHWSLQSFLEGHGEEAWARLKQTESYKSSPEDFETVFALSQQIIPSAAPALKSLASISETGGPKINESNAAMLSDMIDSLDHIPADALDYLKVDHTDINHMLSWGMRVLTVNDVITDAELLLLKKCSAKDGHPWDHDFNWADPHARGLWALELGETFKKTGMQHVIAHKILHVMGNVAEKPLHETASSQTFMADIMSIAMLAADVELLRQLHAECEKHFFLAKGLLSELLPGLEFKREGSHSQRELMKHLEWTRRQLIHNADTKEKAQLFNDLLNLLWRLLDLPLNTFFARDAETAFPLPLDTSAKKVDSTAKNVDGKTDAKLGKSGRRRKEKKT